MTAFLGSLQLRRRDAADWTALNPILTDRELGYEQDTKKAKLGDGLTPWNALAYYSDPIVLAMIQTEITNRINGDAATLASAQAYSDSIIVNLWKDQGSFTPSGTYPTALDTTPAVAMIKRGFIWVITGLGIDGNGFPVQALIGAQKVQDGDVLRALVNSPGQTDANWAILQMNIDYTPENVVNKSIDIETDKASNVKYVGVKVLYDWSIGKFTQLTSLLTGFTVAGTRANLAAADSILTAFGKIQKFFNDLGDLAYFNRASIAETNAGTDATKIPAVDVLKASIYTDQTGTKVSVIASGTDTYTGALVPAITAYSGIIVWVLFTNANTVINPTLNLGGGVRGFVQADGSNIMIGALKGWVELKDNGTAWQLLGRSVGGLGAGNVPSVNQALPGKSFINISSTVANTGNTTENVVAASINLVGYVEANDHFYISLLALATNNANTKSMRFHISDSPSALVNSQLIGLYTVTTALTNASLIQKYFGIRGNLNAAQNVMIQVGASSSFAAGNVSFIQVNLTGTPKYVVVTLQNAVGTDTIQILSLWGTHFRP